MWFFMLLVLALAAFFIVKAVKASASRKAAENDRLSEGTGLTGSLGHNKHISTNSEDTSTASNTSPESVTNNLQNSATAASSSTSEYSADVNTILNTGNNLHDIQEMIKVLNLTESDAGRLSINREEFAALRSGDTAGMPTTEVLEELADRLREMTA